MATKTKTKTKIRPLDDRVLIKPDVPEDRTASGIYLPEGAKEKPITGKVVAVGPGKLADDGTRTAISVKAGDTVVYGKYTGTARTSSSRARALRCSSTGTSGTAIASPVGNTSSSRTG